MRPFEITTWACSPCFELLAEVACPHQRPFFVPASRLGGLHVSFVLPIRPKATCHLSSFPTVMVSIPSTSGVLYSSVTTFPLPLAAHVRHFFSLLAGFDPHQWVHLRFLLRCARHSVWHSPLRITGMLCISISLCLVILHFFFATSRWGYHVLDLGSQHV